MGFLQFCEVLKKELCELLGDEYVIETQSVRKNNGIVLTALFIKKANLQPSPTFYLEELYEEYYRGEALENIVSYLADKFTETNDDILDSLSNFMEYDFVKDKIVFRIVNYYDNEELLSEVPHRKILDLAYIYCCRVEIGSFSASGTVGNIIIKNEHLNFWEIDEKELYSIANKNTPVLMKEHITYMEDMIKMLLMAKGAYDEIDSFEFDTDSSDLYVLSNNGCAYGAGAMLYNGILKKFANEKNKNFYIIPSSIHEVLLLLTDSVDNNHAKELKNIIKCVNDNQVKSEERLSYNLYYYDRKADKIKIV